MSLSKYRRPRLVIQNAQRSVHDAARAMESNHVGVIIVQDRGKVVGVLTDRDLAVRVVGYGLDPMQTTIAEVMSTDVATLSVDATEEQAIDLMVTRRVRRVPLVEADHVVGLVTLDDLLLEGGGSLPQLARVVGTQLAEPAALKPRGKVFPVEPVYGTALPTHGRRESAEERGLHRHAARAEETFGKLIHRVQTMAGLESREVAVTALELVLSGIVRRVTPQEASDLVAQLPSTLRDRLLDLRAGPDRDVSRGSIERELSQRLDLSADQAARLVTDVGAALEQAVSAGEIDDVVAQLPREMRGIFPSAAARTP
jgi:uncharacterized protein (DUF2267 family)/predicted transcriptional regulator